MLYSTVDGQTLKICRRLKLLIEEAPCTVRLLPVSETTGNDLRGHDAVVLGASIRYGQHSPLVRDFVRANRNTLAAMPTAFFSVNVVARKAGKDRPENNPYLKKFLRQSGWTPTVCDVFAGRLDYPSYGVLDRGMIRLIMALTGGPTGPRTVVEYTDWGRVDEFGRLLCRTLGFPRAG